MYMYVVNYKSVFYCVIRAEAPDVRRGSFRSRVRPTRRDSPQPVPAVDGWHERVRLLGSLQGNYYSALLELLSLYSTCTVHTYVRVRVHPPDFCFVDFREVVVTQFTMFVPLTFTTTRMSATPGPIAWQWTTTDDVRPRPRKQSLVVRVQRHTALV